jgi:hypothetical protein
MQRKEKSRIINVVEKHNLYNNLFAMFSLFGKYLNIKLNQNS